MTLMIQQEDDNKPLHFDPQSIGRLKDPVIVLRKVNPKRLQGRETPQADTAWELIAKAQVQLHLREDRLPWLEQGFIINDQPRDEKVSRDIEKATIGFAVARTDTGEILQVFAKEDIDKAYETARSARMVITPSIQMLAGNKEENDDALISEFLKSAEKDAEVTPMAEPTQEA